MRAPKARFELRIVMVHMGIVIYILQDFVPKFDCGTWHHLDIALVITFRIIFVELFSLIYMKQFPVIWWVLYTETMFTCAKQNKIRILLSTYILENKIAILPRGLYPASFPGIVYTKQCRILLRILPPILFLVGWLFLVSLVDLRHLNAPWKLVSRQGSWMWRLDLDFLQLGF